MTTAIARKALKEAQQEWNEAFDKALEDGNPDDYARLDAAREKEAQARQDYAVACAE